MRSVLLLTATAWFHLFALDMTTSWRLTFFALHFFCQNQKNEEQCVNVDKIKVFSPATAPLFASWGPQSWGHAQDASNTGATADCAALLSVCLRYWNFPLTLHYAAKPTLSTPSFLFSLSESALYRMSTELFRLHRQKKIHSDSWPPNESCLIVSFIYH